MPQKKYSLKKINNHSIKNKNLQTKKKSKEIQNLKNKITYNYDKINECLKGIDVIYYINLDRSIDRRENVEKLLKNIKKPYNRIRATDGILFSDEVVYGKFTNVNEGAINSKITKKEYACLLSHLEAIREFSNSKYENALILEDDFTFEFSKFWNKTIEEIMDEAPCNWEILMLGYTTSKNIITPTLYTENYKHEHIFSTLSYVINKESARKLIDNIYKNGIYHLDKEKKHAADWFIYQSLKTYTYKYAYFTYPTFDKSTIHDRSILPYIFSKYITIINWISSFKESEFIYKYENSIKTLKNDIYDIQIYDTYDYFIASYYVNNNTNKLLTVIFKHKNNYDNIIYMIKKPKILPDINSYNKKEILNILNAKNEMNIITNYIKKYL